MVTSSAVVGSSGNDELGVVGQGDGDDDSLAHSAENSKGYWSMRVSGEGMPTRLMSSRARCLACCFVMEVWLRMGSHSCLPIFMVGFKKVMGS